MSHPRPPASELWCLMSAVDGSGLLPSRERLAMAVTRSFRLQLGWRVKRFGMAGPKSKQGWKPADGFAARAQAGHGSNSSNRAWKMHWNDWSIR